MILKLVTAAELPRQCSTEFPNGSPCDVAGISLADPDSCYHYYQCMETGCVEQLECGQHLVFDDQVTFMCQDSAQVNCGSRPCTDPQHCTPASTQSPEDCTPPDQWIDCHETGPGYWPDPFNCRRYWQCDVTGAATHHLCEDNMMYDLVYDGCNYEEQTACGDRPKCDECNQDCKPPCHHEFGESTWIQSKCVRFLAMCLQTKFSVIGLAFKAKNTLESSSNSFLI